MISIKLPDGSVRELENGASAGDLAASIGAGLAKAAVGAKVNGEIWDIRLPLPDQAEVSILTKRDAEALEILRHSAAHLMADAILRLFPQAELTIGPVVDEGFYYDIYLPEGKITPDDFPAIEKEMQAIVKTGVAFERHVSDGNDEIFARYRAIDGGSNKFKEELVAGIKERGEELSFYKHGEFVDLCRGPHVPAVKFLEHVKLTKVSGSYWRADASREQLTRIYGTAFFSKKELKDHLNAIEEAKKRDHRVLGDKLDLFFFEEDAPGFPFFLPQGTTLFNSLANYMRSLLKTRGYEEVKTPLILSEAMWHRSGHYQNYLENMFFTKLKLRDPKNPNDLDSIIDNAEQDRAMAVKPMNCPGHVVVYRSRQRSHNEFPMRFAEMGLVHRRELSGVRHGLFRVQAFTQDDAHHFCTPDQIADEVRLLIEFIHEVYATFDLKDVRLELSTRPEKSIGSDEMWEKAEEALRQALESKGIDYQLNEGDGAFYGPKIDFHVRDVLNRSWQCGTIQVDFSMPERFGLQYVGADGGRHTPVMIHRACYGSLERFMGIIIENYAGKFPTWLSPVQAVVIPVTDKVNEYAKKVQAKLVDAGMRCQVDLSGERVGYKIRQVSLKRLPYAIVVGEKEAEAGTINVRERDVEKQKELSIDEFLKSVQLAPGSQRDAEGVGA